MSREGVLYTTKPTAKDVVAGCNGLSRRASQEWMDRGVWILYLGIGILKWVTRAGQKGRRRRVPCCFFRSRLSSRDREDWKRSATEEEAAVNPALWLRLEGELGLPMPEFDPEEPIDVRAVLEAYAQRSQIKRSGDRAARRAEDV